MTPADCVPLIDVSAAQGVVDWAAVAASGVRAVYVEHGVGNDAANPLAAAQVAGARAAKLLVGRYDFLYPIGLPGAGRDPQSQAARHLGLALGPYDLPSVIDLEWPERAQWARWGCSGPQIVQWAADYLAARPDVTRLYAAPGYLAELGDVSALARLDLWLADWAPEASIPPPWADWAVWQHTARGTVPGITGAVDLSWLRVPPSAISTRPDLAPPDSDA